MTKMKKRVRNPRPKKTPLADALRKAIYDSGLSQAEISRRSGVQQAGLSVFLSGRGITLDTAERLIETLKLQFVLK